MQQVTVSITLPRDAVEAIARIAAAEDRSRASVARRLLLRGLAAVEAAKEPK